MITDPGAIRRHRGLAMVQHVDGFGTPGQKLGTFHAVVRPRQFHLGFKLFYDEDRHRMRPSRVRAHPAPGELRELSVGALPGGAGPPACDRQSP